MNTPSRFDHLHFIERDDAVAAELAATLASRDDAHRFEIIHGDANEELVRLTPRISRRPPTFVFIDPETIDPPWATIEVLSGHQTELFLNFPLGFAINRNPDSAKVGAYFPPRSDWRAVWSRAPYAGRERDLLELYRAGLRELGWVYQVDDPRLISTEPGAAGHRLYYLLPASKVQPAKTIMRWVFSQPDSRGQGRLFH